MEKYPVLWLGRRRRDVSSLISFEFDGDGTLPEPATEPELEQSQLVSSTPQDQLPSYPKGSHPEVAPWQPSWGAGGPFTKGASVLYLKS